MDKIAVASLAVTSVAAVAAIVAAYYAYRSPSKEDLKRVEENTAKSATHINSVRDHIETVAKYMGDQHRRDQLIARAKQVSISVTAQSFTDEMMRARFVVLNSDATILRAELLNKQFMQVGIVECFPKGTRTFTALLDPQIARNWYSSGEVKTGNERLLTIRAYLSLGGEDAHRTFSAEMYQTSQPDVKRNNIFAPVFVLNGKC